MVFVCLLQQLQHQFPKVLIDPYNLWIVFKGILSHYSVRLSSNSSRDDGSRNQCLIWISKNNHKCSIILRFGDCAGHTRCTTSLQCSLCHSLTILTVWIGVLLSWKIAFSSGNSAWAIEWSWLLNTFTLCASYLRKEIIHH